MKKCLSLVLMLVMVLSVTGCGKSSKDTISPELITEVSLSYRYTVGGAFSIQLGELLRKCCPDYKIEFYTYEEKKSEMLSTEAINEYEGGDYADHLDNAYFVTFSGSIMENPQIPYLVTEVDDILTLLLVFDEQDQCMATALIGRCAQIETCAILLTTRF